jgi:hypothetical protein
MRMVTTAPVWLKLDSALHVDWRNLEANRSVDLKIQKSKPSCNARTPSSPSSWKSTPFKKSA